LRSRSSRLALLVFLGAICFGGSAQARVFYSRAEALELAFPEADRIENRTFALDEGQVARIEELARGALESRLVKIYTGWKDGELLGYAFIDLHTVRTLPEAFLIVLSPEGALYDLRVLAFHEPLEYLPAARWYAQFRGSTLDAPLRVGDDVHGVTGATLSARATARGVRRALALYQVLLRNGR
jgi:hypothetical protein